MNKVGSSEVGSSEVGSFEVGISEVGISEVGSSEVGSSEVGISEVGSSEVGISEVGISEVGSSEVGSSEVGSSEVGSFEVGSLSVRMRLDPEFVKSQHFSQFFACHLTPHVQVLPSGVTLAANRAIAIGAIGSSHHPAFDECSNMSIAQFRITTHLLIVSLLVTTKASFLVIHRLD